VADNETNPNVLPDGTIAKAQDGYALFPVHDQLSELNTWRDVWSTAIDAFDGTKELLKALMQAPSNERYGQRTMLPGSYDRNLVEWPGVQPATLRKICSDDNLIVSAVIQQRLMDIDRYCGMSTHIWKPGWRIEMRERSAEPTASDLKDIQEATHFIANCNAESNWDARHRDRHGLTGFRQFMKTWMRDSLRYDFGAIWTDMARDGKVKAFKAFPGSNVKLAAEGGFEGDPNIFAVSCDDAGTVIDRFTRDNLCLLVRNPRTDPGVANYGYSELEMTLRVIGAFTNAFNMNADIFTRSAVPNGFLKLKGLWTPRQVEGLSRVWRNLKTGPTKQHALPAFPVPKDGDIELVDLTNIKGNDIYYREYINMMGGLFCAISGFPVNRLGYHLSGGSDESPKTGQSSADLVDEADPGLPGLLEGAEEHLSQYLIWTRWPHLILRFYGKNPKEDARAYEAKRNSMTLAEMRASNDMPKLETLGKKPEHKELLELMSMSPLDPGMAGIWQGLVSSYISAKFGAEKAADGEKPPGARMTPNKDPAKTEAKGETAGVRRDSAGEKGKVAKAGTEPDGEDVGEAPEEDVEEAVT